MEQEEKKPTTLTGVDLSQTASLLLPWTHDPWGKLRPPLSEEALCMSAELASAAYGMAIEPWVEAGWRDVTIQVDGELTALPPNNPLSAEWRKYWVRARLKPVSALGQMLGALRLSSSNNTTGKAVVMLHPALDGRYVVAVGFMGTGSRFYDWFSNFRMTTQNGMHRGFLELARQFEANEEKISFPETAEELGLEKLTLRDILQNMRSPNSRFVLWVCGHSQGAAMMQVYAHLKMNETGISARNLIGYGFASPTVMAGRAVHDPSAYPLYNVLNSDDLVPHCGAAVHLGMCLKYQATENLRKSCYNWKRDEKSVQARLAIRPVLWKMVDTPTCIIGGMALLMALGRVSGADFLKMLGLGGFLPLDRALEKADAEDFVRGLNQKAAAAYESVTGHPIDMGQVSDEANAMQRIIDHFGLLSFIDAAKALMTCPHYMMAHPEEGYIGTYFYIVMNGIQDFVPFIWRSGDPPRRMTVEQLPHDMVTQDMPGLYNRRLQKPDRRKHLPITRRDPRPGGDTRHHLPLLTAGTVQPNEKIYPVEDIELR